MSNAVKSRRNHYELLGLRPDASAAEISRAFKREIGLFRPRAIGGVAEVGLAFETLRDPAKRAAYDAAIGVNRAPLPPAPKPYITNAVYLHASPTFVPAKTAPPAAGATKPVADAVPAMPAFLTEPARPTDPPLTASEAGILADERDDAPVVINRTVAVAGALMLTVGLVGAWAGSRAGREAQQAQPASVVTASLPKAKPAVRPAELALAGAVPVAAALPVQAEPRRTHRAVERQLARPAAAAGEAVPEPRSAAEANKFARESIAQATALPATVDGPEPAPARTASLPLSDATVARTIQRIGYSCGKVSATVAGDAADAFTITCTSGQSFQARPVRGRYHFRRIGG